MKCSVFRLLLAAQFSLGDNGFKVSEDFYPNNINVEVFTRSWEPNKKSVAHVVFVHGQADHVNRYNHVFSEFASSGIKVHAFDQVGTGYTGVRAMNLGGAMGMERVKLDIDDAIARIDDGKTPLFLMGQSFGGATILDYLARGNKREIIYGALATSPDLELARESKPLSPLIKILLNIANQHPTRLVTAKINPSHLTRDKSQVRAYIADSMTFSRCAAIQVRDTVVGGRYILDGGYRNIQVQRLMIAHGTGDKITSHEASERLSQTLSRQEFPNVVKFKSYAGGYHELHNDIIKDEVIRDYINWILAQL